MEKAQGACSLTTYNMLIDAFARAGDMNQVAQFFKRMCQNGLSPDLVTFSTIIKGYSAKGEMEPALQLFTQMRKQGIQPDSILFNSILDGCAHKQMRGLTEQVLGDMENSGIAPSNFTLSILIKLYGRCGDLDKVMEVIDVYPKKYGFKLNAQVYTCLMSSCMSNGQPGRALSAWKQMKEAGCPADAKTYHTLIRGCLQNSELESSVELLGEALAATPPVTLEREVIDNVVFMVNRRGRDSDLGVTLQKQLQEAGSYVAESRTRTQRAGGNSNASRNSPSASRFHAARRGDRRGPMPVREQRELAPVTPPPSRPVA
jgi:pentatricopeptide repeat protein